MPFWSDIIGWILTATVIFGNGLVIFLITTRRNLRTLTNWFVLSLSVADFGVGAVYFPRYSLCQIDSQTGCVNYAVFFGYSLGIFFIYGSVTNLCALTLDRYLAIVKPLKYIPFMTKKRVVHLILVTWITPSILFISFLLIFLASSGESQEIVKKVACICCTLLGLCVGVFLVFASTRVFQIAQRLARQNTALIAQLDFNYRKYHGKASEPHEVTASKMVGTLVAVFVICSFLDVYITSCWCVGLCTPHDTLGPVHVFLILANSAANPLAYAFFKKDFRKELVLLLYRRKMLSCRQAL